MQLLRRKEGRRREDGEPAALEGVATVGTRERQKEAGEAHAHLLIL